VWTKHFLFGHVTILEFLALTPVKETNIIDNAMEMRNNIYTTIFIQLFYNFLSHTYIMFLFSLFLFLSLLFLTNEKREQQGCLKGCTKIVVQISLENYMYFQF